MLLPTLIILTVTKKAFCNFRPKGTHMKVGSVPVKRRFFFENLFFFSLSFEGSCQMFCRRNSMQVEQPT